MEWLDAMNRGSLIHHVFEDLVVLYLKSNEINNDKKWLHFLENRANASLGSIVEEASKEFEKEKEGVPPSVIREEQEQISKIANDFIIREIEQVKKTEFFPIKVEAKFEKLAYSFKKEGQMKTLYFKGVVDRLDGDGKGHYRVLDYKTGKNRFKNGESLFLDEGDYTHFQHSIYGLWALQQSGESIQTNLLSTGYYFTSSQGKWAYVLSPYTEMEAEMEACMELFYNALVSGEFCKNAGACRTCDFKLVCGGVPDIRGKLTDRPQQLVQIEESLTAGEKI